MSTTRSDLVGYKLGRLEVVSYLGKGKHDKHYWGCSCACGGNVVLPTYRITGSVPTLSCGCLRKENLVSHRHDGVKHGLHKHKLYSVYYAMLYRCNNPKAPRWQYYGGKGVSVCKEWQTFEAFYQWATTNGYEEGLTIDRVDNNKDYEPSNCRWITRSENTRRAHLGRKSRRSLQEDSCSP